MGLIFSQIIWSSSFGNCIEICANKIERDLIYILSVNKVQTESMSSVSQCTIKAVHLDNYRFEI